MESKDFAKEQRDVWLNMFYYSNRRQNENADYFTKLEIEIASIFLALSVSLFNDNISDALLYVKYFFILGIIFLVLSLFFGLFNFHVKSKFWDQETGIYNLCIFEWTEVLKNKTSEEHAQLSCDKIKQGKNKKSSPSWPWILQTLFLFFGVILIFTSIIGFIL